jgi:hypothetical protein
VTLQFRDEDFAAKLTGCDNLTPRQKQAVDKLADQSAELDCVENYYPNEQSQTIENSSYGYALWQELLARHRAEVQMLADYGVTKVRREAQYFRGAKPYDRDDPWNPPCEMLTVASDPSYVHPLTSAYPLITAVPDSRCCDIAITSKCNDRADDELFVKHGQMLGFWHACHNCLSWLCEMARVEHEHIAGCDSEQELLDRKLEHFHQVWQLFGYPSRDLSGFMRLPLTVPDRTGRMRQGVGPNLRLV